MLINLIKMTMDYKLIGVPCGHHGSYTFYKAFKYSKNGKTNILALSEFFFVKLWNDSDLVSIGELQLLWEDKNTEQTLASLRLYILPENTPEGRNDFHGEDEVLAITEKVVIRLEDLLTWITDATDWNWGLSAVWNEDCRSKKYVPPLRPQLLNDCTVIDLDDIDKEKDLLDESHWETSTGVVVLSFPRYCRYRGILKRLEGVHNKWLRTALVVALGGFTVPCRNTRVLFCKDTFDYPDLEGHELLCNHLAPKLKGRPRRKRKRLSSRTPSPGESEDSESESSERSTNSSSSNNNINDNINNNVNKGKIGLPLNRNRSGIQVSLSPRRSARATSVTLQEKEFLGKLHTFMKNRQTPINRVPTIGFKEIDLYVFYNKVKHLGGYDAVTASRLWKYVYEEIGGDQNSTSAATISRRHYEKLLLPYERQLGGQNITVKGKQIIEITSSTTPATTATTTNTTSSDRSLTTTSISSSVTISPSVTATLVTVQSQDKDKKTIGLASKPSSLRGIRLKPDKDKTTNNHNNIADVKTGGKENIPLKNTTTTTTTTTSAVVKPQPPVLTEFIDLVSDDSRSPNKTISSATTVPSSLKKQKLEILKEGGLEVTPVTSIMAVNNLTTLNNNNNKTNNSSNNLTNNVVSSTSSNSSNSSSNNNNSSSTSSSSSSKNNNNISINIPQPSVRNNQSQNCTAKSDENRPSVIRHAYPLENNSNSNSSSSSNSNNNNSSIKPNKISITVTPDVTSMLTMSGISPTSSTSSSSSASSPRVPSISNPSPLSAQISRSQPPPPLGIWQKSRPTIYGNPKDVFQQPTKRPVAEEVLDLRTKTTDNNKNNNTSTQKHNSSSIMNKNNNPNNLNKNITTSPYGQIGSNLEITLVPANKYNNSNSNSNQIHTNNNSANLLPNHNHLISQHKLQRRRKSHSTSSITPIQNLFNNGYNLNNVTLQNLNMSSKSSHHSMNMGTSKSHSQQSSSSLVIPNVSLTVNQKKMQQQQLQYQNNQKKMLQQITSTTLQHQNNVTSSSSRLSSTTTTSHNDYHRVMNYQNHHNKMPFIPAAVALDPMYLSALFNGLLPHGLPPATSSSSSSSYRHNNLYSSNPTPEQLQSYRELLRRHSLPHTTLPDGFPRLLNDGSTSISLVSNHNTPTSK